jgi:hypothetical protein
VKQHERTGVTAGALSGRSTRPASSDGTLTRVGSVTVPGAVGGEGIVAG